MASRHVSAVLRSNQWATGTPYHRQHGSSVCWFRLAKPDRVANRLPVLRSGRL